MNRVPLSFVAGDMRASSRLGRAAVTVPAPAPIAEFDGLLEREVERTQLLERVAALRQREGVGGSVMVFGEAGVGKTSLLRVVRQRAGSDVQWLWGTCEPLLSAPPLGPLIDLLDQLPLSLAAAVRSGHRIQDVLAGVLAMLRDRAAPIVLVIDDAQWADSATLDLLRYVGRRLDATRALLVLSYRDDALLADHPLRTVLGGLPARSNSRIELRPLSRTAVAELALRAGRNARGLYRATQGNPFFVTELLAGDGTALPASVRDAVLARAARLSAGARDVLERVSVASVPLERELVEPAPGALSAAIGECGDAGLLLQDGLALRFRHELARQSVESSLPPMRARALHADLFALLSARGASAVRRVHHAERAGLGAAVLETAAQAAREAAEASAHRQAAALYGLALANAAGLSARERAPLFEARAIECALVNLIDEAIVARLQALALRRQLGDERGAGINLWVLARLEYFRSGTAAALPYADAAVATLEPLGHDRELAMACAAMAQVHVLDETATASLAWGRRALALAETLGDAEVQVYALNTVAAAGLRTDDDPQDWQRLRRSLALALEHGFEEHAARAYTNLPSLALVHRRFDEVLGVCAEGITYCESLDLDMYVARLRIRRAYAWVELGRWAKAETELTLALGLPALTVVDREHAVHVTMLIHLRRGDADRAVHAYWHALLSGARKHSVEPWCMPVPVARVEAAWWLADADAVERCALPALASALRTDDPWRIGQLACWLHRVGRLPAGFSGRVAPPCEAELRCDVPGAAAAWAALGCRHDQALALLAGGESELREALSLFEDLGAAAGARVARQRLRALGAQRVQRGPQPRTRAHPHGLTAREREVLALLGQGLSNRDIASRLHRSERTVEHHVSALLGKLGAGSRSEAVEAATRADSPPQR